MKIKTNQTFKNLRDKTILFAPEENGKKEPLTLGMVLADIVLAPSKNKNGFKIY